MDAWRIFEDRAKAFMETAMAQERVISTASLRLFSPDDRGIVVASPIVNTGGILIGGLAIAVSLDDIALTVRSQAQNTALIAFVLLGLTAVAALWGTRLLTNPIEIIADAARQVEGGQPPDHEIMQPVMGRSDEIGSLARVFLNMTVQIFSREEQLETLVSERTQELQTSNQHLRIAQEAVDQDLEMAKIDFVDVVGPSDGTLFFVIGDVSGKGVAAALFMAASQSAVKSAFLGRAEITTIAAEVAAIAEDTNRRLCSQNPMGMFVTCMLAMVNLENGAVDYVCAGHEPAFLIGNDDSRPGAPSDRRTRDGLDGGLRLLERTRGPSAGRNTVHVYRRSHRCHGPQRRAVRQGAAGGNVARFFAPIAGAHRGQYLEPDRGLLGRHRGRRRHDLPRFAAPVNFANREGRFPA